MREKRQVKTIVHGCIGIALLPIDKAEEGFQVMKVSLSCANFKTAAC